MANGTQSHTNANVSGENIRQTNRQSASQTFRLINSLCGGRYDAIKTSLGLCFDISDTRIKIIVHWLPFEPQLGDITKLEKWKTPQIKSHTIMPYLQS